MPVYRNAAGELREFPQDALEAHEPVFHFRVYRWDPHESQPVGAVEAEVLVWKRVRDYRLLPLGAVKKLLYGSEED